MANDGLCVGVTVACAMCGLHKKPRGRAAPLWMANGLCDQDCDGYYREPHVGSLWPDETCRDFGYCIKHVEGVSNGK
jgi:hypothetical protein